MRSTIHGTLGSYQITPDWEGVIQVVIREGERLLSSGIVDRVMSSTPRLMFTETGTAAWNAAAFEPCVETVFFKDCFRDWEVVKSMLKTSMNRADYAQERLDAYAGAIAAIYATSHYRGIHDDLNLVQKHRINNLQQMALEAERLIEDIENRTIKKEML